MADFQSQVVTITQPVGNGAQTISGLSFEPKAALFFTAGDTADGGANNDFLTGIGAAANTGGTITQGAISGVSDDGNTDTVGISRITNAGCIALSSATGTSVGVASVTVWNSDGVGLNWTTNDGTQRIIIGVFLGGTDITGAKVGATARPTATGNQTVSVGDFEPDALFTFWSGERTTANPGTDGFNIAAGLGWTDGTSQGANSWGERTSRTTGDTQSTQRTSQIIIFNAGGNDIVSQASFSSFSATGGGDFTLNFGTVNIRAGFYGWLALAGSNLSFKAGSFSADTDLGAQAVTGTGFQPQLLLVQSFQRTPTIVLSPLARFALGAATSSTNRMGIWGGGVQGAATIDNARWTEQDELITFATPGAAGSPTLVAEADLTSFDSNGFTLDWTDASPGAYQILYFAMKGTDGGAPASPNTYRRQIIVTE